MSAPQPAYSSTIDLGATQRAFITSRAEADLFSCRMGEGKSTALCWSIFYHTTHNPGARWALIRGTWEDLRDTTLVEFFKWFPEGVLVDYRKSEKRLIWLPDSGLTGEIMLMGMDDPQDASKLQSRELGAFAMDEPAPAAETGGIAEFIFTTAMTRLRQPGMNWYAVKLAQNSSDETHWTYKRFFDPGNPGDPKMPLPPKQKHGFRVFQTGRPENTKNLPAGYYQRMEAQYEADGRTDLRDRFARGDVGFQQPGKPVTPEFVRSLHVRPGLLELDVELRLLWDFGGSPCCHMSQVTPMGHWNILETHQSDGGMGVFEMIEEVIAGRIADRFHGAAITHYGDPAGMQKEQSKASQSAVKMLKQMLGGRWVPGPVKFNERLQPLRRVLGLMRNGTGLVQIDEEDAKACWMSLRGGWHYKVHPNGVVADRPVKDNHSHPGDALGYGAAEIFPGGAMKTRKRSGFVQMQTPTYGIRRPTAPVDELFNAQPGAAPPKDGESPFMLSRDPYGRTIKVRKE